MWISISLSVISILIASYGVYLSYINRDVLVWSSKYYSLSPELRTRLTSINNANRGNSFTHDDIQGEIKDSDATLKVLQRRDWITEDDGSYRIPSSARTAIDLFSD